MGKTLLLSLLFCIFTGILSQDSNDVTVIISGSSLLGETKDDYVCATIDWWPPEKCNYNQCPWGQASALNLDLENPLLAKAIAAFGSLRIRLGGSLQDQVVYETSNLESQCTGFTKSSSWLFGFSQGCLSMERWDALNDLFLKTGAVVTFGLNALRGRHLVRKGKYSGAWNGTNARDFIKYTIEKDYPIDSWEFGNELSGSGVGASVAAYQYGKDIITLRTMLSELYENCKIKPLLVAPGGFYEQRWYAQLLQVSGVSAMDAVTHHIYNLGGGNDPHVASRILDPYYLDRISDTFRDLELTIQRHGQWTRAWVGEAGGAYNSGSPLISNSFLNSFWYLDQLGLAAKYKTAVYCRQSLIGGNYGLLDTETFIPNPDYYSALLWHQLMGSGVLSLDISGSPYLRAYAHCSKNKEGVTVLLLNLNRSTAFTVTVQNDINADIGEGFGIERDAFFLHGLKRTVLWIGSKASDGSEMREEYHLTAKDNYELSRIMLLNGAPLELIEGEIPTLNPVLVPVNSPIYVAPLSIVFVVFPNFEAKACNR
ncbi:Heparanase [Rhynchospora pubera]|uniref:Heparanase n=1 Tax=Rhynchospora pubera TaxID=906938 RepID=A0AAV8ER25_9POAL|nr:Heparanase [Rhynchospora pubera]